MIASTLSPADHAAVTAQLGRPPRHACGVAARCPAGHVAVIATQPLQSRGGHLVPFPTLYWLTCPRLHTLLAGLERDGLIARLTQRLRHDPDLQAALAADHEDYIRRRAELLDVPMTVPGAGGGIAGMTSRLAVKCLHAHYAHHMVSHNAIGRILEVEFGIRPCPRSDIKTP